MASARPYVVYVAEPPLSSDDERIIAAQWATTVDGHAGENETSAIMAIRPDLVRIDQLPTDGEGLPLDRLKPLRDVGVDTGIWWYADHPTHYRGDGRPATAEKGHRLLDARARALAHVIHLIKQDRETRRLQDEFFATAERHAAA